MPYTPYVARAAGATKLHAIIVCPSRRVCRRVGHVCPCLPGGSRATGFLPTSAPTHGPFVTSHRHADLGAPRGTLTWESSEE